LKTIARGDFETKKYPGNMPEFQQWINDLRAKIGARRAKTIEVLVQNPIKSACEAGWDGFHVNGSYIKNGMVGYEIKDNGLVGKIMEEPPGVLKAVNDKMSPILRELGGMGHFSTEVRITEAGTGYFIDPTMRAPSPPSELMCEIYENYAEAVYQIACGKLPIMKPRAKFGAEIIMKSPAYEKSELYVSFPKELYPFVKLKDQMKDGGDYICLPNGNGSFFGAVIAMANTRKEAEKKAMEYIEQVKADEFEYDKDLFAEEEATIAKGEKFGIDFS
jgi:predicted RNase H-like HicB family nuclease